MPRILSCMWIVVLAMPVVAEPTVEHWAWKAPVRPSIPRTTDRLQPPNPIDAFIHAKLTAVGLKPAPAASREHLIRRVTFDLTGLPPTPDEVDAFVSDTSPNAWARVVDRLLASPRYGERWGRHWLDLARYADTNGYEFDEPRPDAWRYRDYVIQSFNADTPYDRFIIEQLAGDQAFPNDPHALIATGFNLLGPDMTDASDPMQRRLNTLNDMTDTTGLVFLGLTITCARCHDHKFEPIPQSDYFRMQAFFASAAFRRDLPIATPAEIAKHQHDLAEYLKLTQPVRDEIAAIEAPTRRALYEAKLARLSEEAQAAHRTAPAQRTGGQQELVAETERLVRVSDAEVAKSLPADAKVKLDTLQSRLKTFDSKRPAPFAVAMGLTDPPGPPQKWHILERGELANQGAEVQPGFPTVLNSREPTETARRLTLAKWIASPANPLTARVLVNRVWQHHFGRGIVRTASDFGTRGDPPTHPELLDWLSHSFVESGWSIKRLHRLMLLSETYQQSTFASPNTLAEDPDNQFFSRMNRLRLEGEAVRDSLLAISGRLNITMGGPGVVLPELARVSGGARPVAVTPDEREHLRRSVYLFNRRNLRHPFLAAFDLPDSNLSCPKRERSTTAPQALALLNSSEASAAAQSLGDRLITDAKTDADRVILAYRLVLGRRPSMKELERACAFLERSPISELCRALFNLNEFVYLD